MLTLDSPNVATIKEVYRAMQEDGMGSGGEYLAAHVCEDARIRLYTTRNRVLHGRNEVRSFYEEAARAGTSVVLRPREFLDGGDKVTVVGSARVQRPEGGFAETQVRWTWRFRDGLIEEADWEPRAGD
jgi:ketosteroid isomerase-like protein